MYNDFSKTKYGWIALSNSLFLKGEILIKKIKERINFSVNYIGFAKRDGLDFLDIELPENDLKVIEEKSRIISNILDEINPYETSYFLNVYSAGTEQMINLNDLDEHLDKNIWIELKKDYLSKNYWEGKLIQNNQFAVTLLVNNKGRFQKLVINKEDITFIKLSAKLKKEKK